MTDSLSLPLTDDPQEMIRNLARLVEISVTLNSTLELEPLLAYILDTAAELLDCAAVSILLYDEKNEQLRFAAATGSSPQALAEIAVPLDNSIAGTIFKENAPVILNKVEQNTRHYTNISEQIGYPVRSLVGVPMQIRTQQVGVLEAINSTTDGFTAADAKLLSIIASQAAVAINNARLVQDLQAANAELSETDEMKNRFMAVASHELRTPLGIIMGYATFLKEEAQGDLSDHASNVLNAALELRTLLEDMTNMNLLYTGQRDIHPEPIALQEILRLIYDEVIVTTDAKNICLKLTMPDQPVIVNADKKIKLVFDNLVNNALRFTPKPGNIHIRLLEMETEALVEVRDDGIGIPPEKLDRIFDQFYQVEDHMTRRYGGLGLGLAIARVLVGLHGGRIWAESDGLGKGACFKVALPHL